MSRIGILPFCSAVSAMALVFAACASPSAPTGSPPVRVQPASDQQAVSLGVAIAARDALERPRLVRAVAPRPAGARGMLAADAARAHLAALAPLWIDDRPPAALATHGQQRLRNGASVVRLQQQVDSIDVHQGELRVLLHADGALAAVSGTMLPATRAATFRSPPAAALDRALDALYGAARARPAIAEGGEHAGYRVLQVAVDPGLRVRTARAKRELLAEAGQLTAIWTVELSAEHVDASGETQRAARRFLIADASGQVLREVDLVAHDAFVYRAFAEPTGRRIPFDGALESFNPHPSDAPDGSRPALVDPNLVVMEAFNGPRDPWLPADAATTSGNNVEAFADIMPPDLFNDGDIRPEVRAGRTLNYHYDLAASALASPTQSKASAVNVFFVSNWLHDWYYDSGFTEATGNAQLDNYGRGGVGGDPLLALAQSDALGGSRDNASMETPADGASPIMRMFLWSGAVAAQLTTPAGTPPTTFFRAGPTAFELDGTAVLVENRSGGGHSACVPVGASVSGKIAVVEVSTSCSNGVMLANVAAAGAIGVIAVIMTPGAFAPLPGNAASRLPGVVIGLEDGRALEAVLPAPVALHREVGIERDGDLDNGVIAHEWGHYLHHRLSSCEAFFGQCTAMSEGWGDFTALHMMLRETDARDRTFRVTLYAVLGGGFEQRGTADLGYFGIRRYPYSLDRAKNPLTLRHIGNDHALPVGVPINARTVGNGNAEAHNAGEVWAQMLWEAYNVLIDEHGFTDAQRRMSDYAVAGLLLTPPDATYTEGRDAILFAASALDTDDMVLMAAAFAGRGAGTCAVGPPRSSDDFTGVVESGTLAARLETSGVSLVDDRASCDRDGILDPGETGTLRVTLSNNGIVGAEGVSVAVATTTPGVTLGPPIHVGSLAAFTQLDLEFPVRLAAGAARDSAIDLALTVTGDAGCNTSRLVVDAHRRTGIDEVPALGTHDAFETAQLVWTRSGTRGGEAWSRVEQASGNHVMFGADVGFAADLQLASPVLHVSTTEPLVVSLEHAYHFEKVPGVDVVFDGGVIEVSSDGGATWRDVLELGVDPGYTGIAITPDNPLFDRPVFAGFSPAYPARQGLVLDFGTQLAGQSVQLRFRIGTDDCCSATGWEIDDIEIRGITNMPFPGYVPESAACTVREAVRDAGGIVEVRRAPHPSLDGVAVPAQP